MTDTHGANGASLVTDNRMVLDRIVEIEGRYPVDEWQLDGLHVWPLLRMRIYVALVHQFLGTGLRGAGQRTHRERILDGMRSVAWQLRARVVDRQGNASPNRAQEAVLLSDGVSFASVEGQWLDRILDPIIAGLAAEGRQSLLLTPMTLVHTPRHSPSLLIQAHLDAAKAWSTAMTRFRSPPRATVEGLEEMLAELAAGNREAELPDYRWLIGQAARVRSMMSFFERLIRRTRAKVAFVNTYYSAEGMAFVWAARRAGCITIDVQHGNQFFNPGYGRWTKVPPSGFELVPHRFWCWSNDEVAVINDGPGATSAHRALNVGNLWVSYLTDRSGDLVARLRAAKTRTGADIHLLLTPSWGLAEHETEKLIAAVQLGAEVQWWLRLHPTQVGRREAIKQQLADRGIANVEVDLATDMPLPLVLAEIDANITPDSSTVLDAAAVGVPSVVTTAHGAAVFAEQIARGQACFADDPADILAAALRLAQAGRIGFGTSSVSDERRRKAAFADAFGSEA